MLPLIVLAAPDPPKRGVAAWLEGDHATGEWGGAREALARRGLTIDIAYTGEVFADVRGGVSTDGAIAYRGDVDLGVTFETEKASLWRGGKLFALAQNGHGHGVTDRYVGALQTVSNLEAESFTQVAELWFEQSLFDGLLVLTFGKHDANREFGSPRYSGNFVNGSFGVPPTIPLPSFPAPGLGGVVVVTPSRFLALRAAAYEGDPQVGSYGFDSAAAPGAGVFTIASVAVTHTFGRDARHGGTTSAGVWHHDGPFAAVRGGGALDGDAGVFVLHDERIYENPKDKDDTQGLHVFGRFAWAPPDRNDDDWYVGGGVAYHGVPHRDNDTVGVGFGAVHLQHALDAVARAPRPGTELLVEVFYKSRLTRWLSLEPDGQFFHDPGGDGRDALVVGGRFKIKP